MTLPTVFLPHGAGPCFFMEWTRGPADTWDRTAAYLRGLVDSLPERPTAILAISGHWEAPAFAVATVLQLAAMSSHRDAGAAQRTGAATSI